MSQIHSKLRSTTFWLSLGMLILNPIAWVMDFVMRKNMIQFIIDHGLDLSKFESLVVQIPLGTIATAAVTVVTAYVAGNKARNVSTNIGLSPGQNGMNQPSSSQTEQ